MGRIGLAVGPFEHLNDVVANPDGVKQRLEAEGEPLNVRHSQVIRNRAERQDQMVVQDFSWRPSAGMSRAIAQNHPALLEVNLRGLSANELRPMQTAAQRSADVAGFEAAPGHFSEHGSKKKRVRIAARGDRDPGGGPALFFQALYLRLAAESTPQEG